MYEEAAGFRRISCCACTKRQLSFDGLVRGELVPVPAVRVTRPTISYSCTGTRQLRVLECCMRSMQHMERRRRGCLLDLHGGRRS